MKNKQRVIAILLAILCCSCQICTAKGKKGRKEQPIILSKFPSSATTEYIFYGGTATLRGRLTHVQDGQMPATMNCRIADYFSHNTEMSLVKIHEDGSFTGHIPLPHAQFSFVDLFRDYVFLFPGDTIDCTFDMKDGSCTFSGDNTSIGVNRLWKQVQAHYFQDMKDSYQASLGSLEELLSYRDDNIAVIDRCANDISADKFPFSAECSPLVGDILKSCVFSKALFNIMDAAMGYNGRKNVYTQDEQGNYRAVPVEGFRPTDPRSYYDFLKGRESFLLDTPLTMFEPTQMFLINRAEFDIFDNSTFEFEKTKDFTDTDMEYTMAAYLHLFLLPDSFSEAFHREALAKRGDTLYTRHRHTRDFLDDVRERYGLGNSFMFQACLTRRLFSMFDGNDTQMTPGMAAAYFAGIMPNLTHPTVCHHATEAFRRYMVKHEGTIRETTDTPEADSILQRMTAPYKDNVVYIDFWGMGCGPCRAGMLAQREFVEKMKDRPVRFLYVCNEKDSPRIPSEEFMKENDIKGEHIFLTNDEWNYLAAKFGISGIPFQVLMDRKGNIVQEGHVHLEENEWEELLK